MGVLTIRDEILMIVEQSGYSSISYINDKSTYTSNDVGNAIYDMLYDELLIKEKDYNNEWSYKLTRRGRIFFNKILKCSVK